MKYHFCLTICGEIDTDVTPIPPPDGGPPYPDIGLPEGPPYPDAGFPPTQPGGRPQWPVDPNYGIEVPPGQEGGPPHIDNRPPSERPIIDADFPVTQPPRPDQGLPPDGGGEGGGEEQPPQVDNTLPGNLPGSPPHIDADFPIHQPGRPGKPCDPGPQAVGRIVSKLVALKKPKGVVIESLNTVVEAMNSRRRKD